MQFQPFSKITYKLIREGPVRTIALQTGEVDVVKDLAQEDEDLFLNPDGASKPGWNATQVYDARLQVLAFNGAPGTVFGDNQALRQAVLYAIKNEDLMLAFGRDHSTGRIVNDLATNVSSDYNDSWDSPDYDYYTQDLDKAKAKLAEAGYKPGELSVGILVRNLAGYDTMATALQAQLGAIGIKVTVEVLEQAVVNEIVLGPDGWDMTIENVYTNDFVVNGYQYLFDSRSYKHGSRYHTIDDKLQELVEVAIHVDTFGPKSRDALHDYVKEKAYIYGLFTYSRLHVAQDGILGIVSSSDANPAPNAFVVSPSFRTRVK